MRRKLTICMVVLGIITSLFLVACDNKQPYFITAHLEFADFVDGKYNLNVEGDVVSIDFADIKLEGGAVLNIFSDKDCTVRVDGYVVTLGYGINNYYLLVESQGKSKTYEYVIIRAEKHALDIVDMPSGMTNKNDILSLTIDNDTAVFDIGSIKCSDGSTIAFYDVNNAAREISGVQNIYFGKNHFSAIVSAKNGDTRSYSIVISRALSNEKKIISSAGAVIYGNICSISLAEHKGSIDLSGTTISKYAQIAFYLDSEMTVTVADISATPLSGCETVIYACVTAQNGSSSVYIISITCPLYECDSCGGAGITGEGHEPEQFDIIAEENVEYYNLSDIDVGHNIAINYYIDSEYLTAIADSKLELEYGVQRAYGKGQCVECSDIRYVNVVIGRRASVTVAIEDSINRIIDINVMIVDMLDSWTISVNGESVLLLKLSVNVMPSSTADSDYLTNNKGNADLYIAPYQDMSSDYLHRNSYPIGLSSKAVIADMPDTAMAVVGDNIDYILPFTLSINSLAYDSVVHQAGAFKHIGDLASYATTEAKKLGVLGNAPSAWDFVTFNAWQSISGIKAIMDYNKSSNIDRLKNAKKIEATQSVYDLFKLIAKGANVRDYSEIKSELMSGNISVAPWVSDSISLDMLSRGIRLQGIGSGVGTAPSILGEISMMIIAPQSSEAISGITSDIISTLYASKSYLLSVANALIVCGKYKESDTSGNAYADMYNELLVATEMIVSRRGEYKEISKGLDPYICYLFDNNSSLYEHVNIGDSSACPTHNNCKKFGQSLKNAIFVARAVGASGLNPQNFVIYQQK